MTVNFKIIAVGTNYKFFFFKVFRVAEPEFEIILESCFGTDGEFCAGHFLQIRGEFIGGKFDNGFGIGGNDDTRLSLAVIGDFKLCSRNESRRDKS